MWLRFRWWYGWNNINIRVKVEFHQFDRPFCDGTRGNERKSTKRGIKMAQNHSQEHPVRKQHLLLVRRGIARGNSVRGANILENDIPNVQTPVCVDGIQKEALKMMTKSLCPP